MAYEDQDNLYGSQPRVYPSHATPSVLSIFMSALQARHQAAVTEAVKAQTQSQNLRNMKDDIENNVMLFRYRNPDGTINYKKIVDDQEAREKKILDAATGQSNMYGQGKLPETHEEYQQKYGTRFGG